jgi:hypothetical protein
VAAACSYKDKASAPPPPSSVSVTTMQAQDGGVAATGEAATITVRATVKAVNQAARTVTLVGPQGETLKVKVGPEVRNLQQVKPGNNVVARITESVAFVIEPPGVKAPEDTLAIATERAKQGAKPAGGVAEMLVVTGLVVAVSPAKNTISMTNPAGGQVVTFVVRDPENQRMLPSVKVGDQITAVITESVVIAVEPGV